MAEPITVTITNLNSPIRVAKVTNKVAESAVTSVAGRVGDITLTKNDVAGVENVNNTSDLNKPISTATQAAIDGIALTPGPIGPIGPSGLQGPIGPSGDIGLTGPIGPSGLQGPIGPSGDIGLTGPIGPSGLQGPIGPSGDIGLTGPIGPSGLQGPIGPSGDIGLTGPIGPSGLQGPIGPSGDIGLTGPIGPSGLQGPIGPSGDIGLTGPIGPSGLQGPIGPSGDIGLTGPIGPSGLQGPIGPSGDIGLTGPIGPSGLQGPIGPSGDIGPSGAIGLTGPSGADAVVDNTAYGISWSGDTTQAATRDALYNEIEILPRFGDNVSDFNNDALYISSGDNVSNLTNDAGYITSADTFGFKYRSETGNYTVVAADYTIDCISGDQTITMLDATTVSGQIFVVKNSSPSVITITGTSSQTFDGNASVETDFPQSLTLQSTNTNWIII